MNYKIEENKVIINLKDDFELKQIFENGQCFRWNATNTGSYIGVVKNRVIEVETLNGEVIIHNTNEEDFRNIWIDYFNLNQSYEDFKKRLKGKNPHLDKAIDYSPGLRLLNQDEFEMIISFIISANNNIPRIKKAIDCLCKRFGSSLGIYKKTEYFSFPNSDELLKASMEEIRSCGVGFRDKYIYETTRQFNNKKEEFLSIKELERQDSINKLKELKGVGDKVASCILLFGYSRGDMIPIDTWIKKVIEKLFSEQIEGYKKPEDYFLKEFGNDLGLVQQYLFYYAREEKI
jgi:N-glycosylase/DNA lyase